MATIDDVYLGIKIMRKYMEPKELESHNFQAEHDQIWCGDYSGDEMEPADYALMRSFGWFKSEESWSKFT